MPTNGARRNLDDAVLTPIQLALVSYIGIDRCREMNRTMVRTLESTSGGPTWIGTTVIADGAPGYQQSQHTRAGHNPFMELGFLRDPVQYTCKYIKTLSLPLKTGIAFEDLDAVLPLLRHPLVAAMLAGFRGGFCRTDERQDRSVYTVGRNI